MIPPLHTITLPIRLQYESGEDSDIQATGGKKTHKIVGENQHALPLMDIKSYPALLAVTSL